MKLQHLFLAPALVVAIAGCNQRPPEAAGQSVATDAPTPVATAPVVDRGNVDFVELALDGSSNESVPLGLGQSTQGKFDAPTGGNVTGFEVQLGNHGNSSAGILTVKLCQVDTCAEGSADLAGSKDNEYFHVALSQPLALAANQSVTYVLTRKEGDNPLSIWTYPSSQATSTTTLPDGSTVPRSLKMGLRYSK